MATRDELEALVEEDPTDDSAFEILGDLLQLEGDPRGELIGLDAAYLRGGDRRLWAQRRAEVLDQYLEGVITDPGPEGKGLLSITPDSRQTVAVYFDDRLRLGKLELNAGGRLQYSPDYPDGAVPLGSLAALYRLKDNVFLKVGFAMGFSRCEDPCPRSGGSDRRAPPGVLPLRRPRAARVLPRPRHRGNPNGTGPASPVVEQL